MAVEATRGLEQPGTVLSFPLTTLAALGALPGLTCGGLSPLARLAAPAEPPDAAGLPALLSRTESLSPAALPTLLDPHLTVAVLVGDQDEPALRQYAWPDAEGRGPGFEVVVRDGALTMLGGATLGELREDFSALLALDELQHLPTLSLTLSAGQFWVLAALIDAYRMSLSARRQLRLGGKPQGVLVDDVLTAWRLGQETHHPGWAVSLFSLLAPDEVPDSFAVTLQQTLEGMDDADLIILLEEELSPGSRATVVFGEDLARLVGGLAGQVWLFGLAVHRMPAADGVTVTTMGGWRTPSSLWFADLPGLAEDKVQLVLASGEFVADLLGSVLQGESAAQFVLETPYTAGSLLALLSAAAPAPAATNASLPRTCAKCGAQIQAGWRFCSKCKSPVEQ